MKQKRIVILGAGISGLSAAYRLHKISSDATILLWEKQPRIGGVLETVHENGFQIEQSADNFITTLPYGLELCRELGLGDNVVQTNPATRRTYVLRKGRLHLLPDGFLMMAPTKLWPMATTPLLSPLGKFRAALELLIPAKRDTEDETLANFVRRRLGNEVFERLVEPLVSGVYAADMDKLSLMATLPRFREMERKHGSLIWAMQKQMRENRKAQLEEQSGARYSMFVTLKDGLSSLCDAIAEKLPSGSLCLNRCADSLELLENGQWRLTDESGASETFDALISGLPSHEIARLLKNSLPQLSAALGKIEHQGTAIVTYAFERCQMKFNPRGMGFVTPKIENSPILAASFSSLKYEHRAPENKLLIRVFAGGARSPEMAEMPDEKLIPLLFAEIAKILKIEGKPTHVWTAHWPRTMPQFHLGHEKLVSEINEQLKKVPTLALCGNYFNGVGVPNCISSGYKAAAMLN